jgi:membrane associated rhomboid family serine protease
MYSCPECHQSLIQKKTEYGIFWACETCDRWLFGIPFLRRTLDTVFFTNFWQAVRLSGEGQGLACPSCSKPMNPVSLDTPDPLALVCKACNLAWLTHEQRTLLPSRAELRAPVPSASIVLPAEAAKMAAMMQVEMIAERAKNKSKFDGDNIPMWKKALCIIGMPLESDRLEVEQPPLCTYLLTLATLAVSVYWLMTDPKASGLGFIPAEPGRYAGLTLFSNFLVHSGWFELGGDLYFLFLFGRGVEAKIRWYGFSALVIFSTLGGNLAALILAPNSTTAILGSGGGIAGILLFYGFVYPRRNLVFYFFRRFIPVPALAVLGVWVFFQVVGAFMQSSAAGLVSYACNFGGLLVGLLAWLIWRWGPGGGNKEEEVEALE